MTNAYADQASTVTQSVRARAVPARWAPRLHAFLRIGAGLLFMEHGLQTLFGLFGGMGPSGGSAPLFSLMGFAGVLESCGALLLLLGLFTRPVAVVLLLEMLYAFSTVHFPKGGAPMQNGGELALLYGLIFAFLAGNGAGPASLDSRRGG